MSSSDKSDKADSGKPAEKKKDRAVEIANTFEWLITAFILAFVFRAFVMEAFRIPTGSMADTLKGAHFRLACPQCGHKYEYGFVPGDYGLGEDTVPANDVPVPITRCPSCGRYPSQTICRPCRQFYDSRAFASKNGDNQDNGPGRDPEGPRTHCPRCGNELTSNQVMPVANGDRILVLKCIYQFFEPKRWDVIVFKNPPEPTINYIKRLIGLPGESVQIIDGDIYINGRIARKPPKVQNELWMPVYENDYQPVQPGEGSFNGHLWEQPFKNLNDSRWATDGDRPTVFRLDSAEGRAGQVHSLVYDTSIGNDFRATYAYDDIDTYNYMPYCSDLMVRFFAQAADSQGSIGIALSKYQTNYKAWVDYRGEMVITRQEEGREAIELARKSIDPPAVNKSVPVRFANVDHELVFEVGGNRLTFDLGRELGGAGPIQEERQPQVEIFGSGKLTLSHIGVLRDIHYTAAKFANSRGDGRATQDSPFVLGEDQFFVLGDNSPNSEDGRWWRFAGRANKGLPAYRVGIVPRDYLVGKALFVYWPSGFKPVARFPFGVIPNVGRMRFIYGGSNGIQ
jgi:signal peptidase I